MGFFDSVKRMGQKVASGVSSGLAIGKKAVEGAGRFGKKVIKGIEKAVETADQIGLGEFLDMPIGKSGMTARGVSSMGKEAVGRGIGISKAVGRGIDAGSSVVRTGRDIVASDISSSDNIQRAKNIRRSAQDVVSAGSSAKQQANKFLNRFV
tara:strand:+ start:7074 stop:7529 length:456 start_codon:yes stop_codon:yes gene_type:complete